MLEVILYLAESSAMIKVFDLVIRFFMEGWVIREYIRKKGGKFQLIPCCEI